MDFRKRGVAKRPWSKLSFSVVLRLVMASTVAAETTNSTAPTTAVIDGISIPIPKACNISNIGLLTAPNTCGIALSACLAGTVTDRLGVCNCYSRNSACYSGLGCLELLPWSTVEYCEDSLLCTSAACSGGAWRLGANVASVSFALMAAAVALPVLRTR